MKNKLLSLSLSDLKNFWKFDLTSGFLIFLIALPLSLGIAMASGFPSMAGIIAACVGGIVVSLLAGSHLIVCGPAAGLIVVILSGMEMLGKGNNEAGYKLTLAAIVVAGIIQIGLGFLKSGRLSTFFPSSVVHGMMAAIGLIIMSKQLHTLLGVKPEASDIVGVIKEIPHSIMHLNPTIAAIGVVSLLLLIFIPKINNPIVRKIPVPMLVVLLGIVFAKLFGIETEQVYRIWDNEFHVGPKYLVQLPKNIADGIVFPDFSAFFTQPFWFVTISIALVASLETLLSSTAIKMIDPQKRNVKFDRDLIALGAGCTISGLLGGLPMIAEIVRSSSNVSNGAKTQWSNFFHGLFLLIFILLFPKVLQEIPLASLAAILIFVGWRLASPKEFVHMFHIGFDQLLVFLVTVLMTLKTDLLLGVLAGIVMEIIVNLIRGLQFGEFFSTKNIIFRQHDKSVRLILRKAATFWNLYNLKQALMRVPDKKEVIIDFSHCRVIDHTMMEFLEIYKVECSEQGCSVVYIGIENFHPHSKHKLSARTKF